MTSSTSYSVQEVMPSSSVVGSAKLFAKDGDEYLVIARGSILSVHSRSNPKDACCKLMALGQIRACISVNDGRCLLVVTADRGRERFSLYANVPQIGCLYTSPVLAEGVGRRLPTSMHSQECDHVVVYQSTEGSVHILWDLHTSHPRNHVFHDVRGTPIVPTRSLVLIPRGDSQFLLITVVGEDHVSTEIRTYEISVSATKATCERVTTLSGALQSVSKDTRPYAVEAHYGTDRVVFVGGDFIRYSAVSILSFSDIFGKSAPDSIHCQPFPHVSITPYTPSSFLLTTSFGELYAIEFSSERTSPKVNLIRSDIIATPIASSCLTWLPTWDLAFVGSQYADSVLVSPVDPLKSPEQMVLCSAPVMAISQCSDSSTQRVITTVSGIGSSARVNRIKTSGISTFKLPVMDSNYSTQNIFLILNGSTLLVSTQTTTLFLSITLPHSSGNPVVELREKPCPIGSPVMGSIVHAYDIPSSAGAILVSSEGNVYRVTSDATGLSTKEVWHPPSSIASSKRCVCAGYCDLSDTLVVLLDGSVSVFTKEASVVTNEFELKSEAEPIAIACYGGLICVVDWSSTLHLYRMDGCHISSSELGNSSIPRSVVVGPDIASRPSSDIYNVTVGFVDGSVTLFSYTDRGGIVLDSAMPLSTRVGLLPAIVRKAHLGRGLNGSAGRPVLVISGDRPSLVTGADSSRPVFTELVESVSGKVLPMRDVVLDTHRNLLWYIDDFAGSIQSHSVNLNRQLLVDQCHVQRTFLSPATQAGPIPSQQTLAVAVQELPSLGLVAVAVSTHSPSCDYVGFFDQFQLEQVGKFELDPLDRISGLAMVGENQLVITTASFGDVPADTSVEPKIGRVILVGRIGSVWSQLAAAELLDTKGAFAGAVYTVAALGAYVIVTCVRTLFVLKLVTRMDESCEFVMVAESACDILAVSVAVTATDTGFRVVVGDISKSCALFEFSSDEGTLNRIASDLIPSACQSVSFIGTDNSVLMGDDLGNVYRSALVEPSLARLERLEGINIGQTSVSCIQRVGEAGAWIGANDGRIFFMKETDSTSVALATDPSGDPTVGAVFEPTRQHMPSVQSTIPITSRSLQ